MGTAGAGMVKNQVEKLRERRDERKQFTVKMRPEVEKMNSVPELRDAILKILEYLDSIKQGE